MNYGLFLGYEKFIYEDLIAVKTIQGVLSDCSNGLAVVSHFGLRATLMQTEKHRISLGMGPTLLVRDSWRRFGEEYVSSGYFNETYVKRLGDVQWKFIPYAFEFEYDYTISSKNEVSMSFTPAVPLAGLFSIGWKHWIKKKEFGQYKIFIPNP